MLPIIGGTRQLSQRITSAHANTQQTLIKSGEKNGFSFICFVIVSNQILRLFGIYVVEWSYTAKSQRKRQREKCLSNWQQYYIWFGKMPFQFSWKENTKKKTDKQQ